MFLVLLYYGFVVMLRFLLVDFEDVEVIVVIGVIYGIVEVIECSVMVFIDYIYY